MLIISNTMFDSISLEKASVYATIDPTKTNNTYSLSLASLRANSVFYDDISVKVNPHKHHQHHLQLVQPVLPQHAYLSALLQHGRLPCGWCFCQHFSHYGLYLSLHKHTHRTASPSHTAHSAAVWPPTATLHLVMGVHCI